LLARANRLKRADDYRNVVRRGKRIRTPHAVVYFVDGSDERQARLGFIVSKAVGNAVTRNLVRRRLKALGRGMLGSLPSGTDIVIRATPGVDQVSWALLQDELMSGMNRMWKK
jgi:ribonuclease P protein component